MSTGAPHIALIELYADGHHRMYLELLARHWLTHEYSGRLSIWVSGRFADVHRDFLTELAGTAIDTHVLHDIPHTLEQNSGVRHLLTCDRWHGHALQKASDSGADHAVFMYLDHAQLAVARFRSQTVGVSGILFKPPGPLSRLSPGSVVKHLRKHVILWRMRNAPNMHCTFVLDPGMVTHNGSKYLPDGITMPAPDTPRQALRSETGHEDQRMVLMFGDLSSRKGIHHLAEAWDGCGHLLLAGRVPDGDPAAQAAVEVLSVRDDVSYTAGYVSDERMSALFQASDVIVLPYDGHVGSSNVLIRAAMAGKPVIACQDGLVGQLVVTHGLGLTVDPADTQAFRSAMCQTNLPFNPTGAAAFSEQHTPDAMGRVFFENIPGTCS